jgi:hypothetical protein
VQGAHQQAAQPFPQRVLVDQLRQLGRQIPIPGPPEREHGFGPVLQRGQPAFAQSQPLRIGERSGDVGKRRGAPQ